MTYLGALFHGAHTIALDRIGRLIRWTLSDPEGVVVQYTDWMVSALDDGGESRCLTLRPARNCPGLRIMPSFLLDGAGVRPRAR